MLHSNPVRERMLEFANNHLLSMLSRLWPTEGGGQMNQDVLLSTPLYCAM